MTLLLTARRQQNTEMTLELTTRDATERRITELYIKAAELLGSDQAPVRIAGLHALERLAQNTPEQQQTIVDVICAYLRMPFTPPVDKAPAEDAPAEAHTRYENHRQELQVRLTAQRILAAHLRPDSPDGFWTGIDLDFTQAHLHMLDLSGCHVRTAQFNGAKFAGDAEFNGARFGGAAGFRGVRFSKDAEFNYVHFHGTASFKGMRVGEYARFERRISMGTRITVAWPERREH
ncbi:MAG: pentapeptide repeat-containing protein [Actinomycetota bacterium]|nr:pentapeptide repeat-containing protein [Actinomycetota bacterium]